MAMYLADVLDDFTLIFWYLENGVCVNALPDERKDDTVSPINAVVENFIF